MIIFKTWGGGRGGRGRIVPDTIDAVFIMAAGCNNNIIAIYNPNRGRCVTSFKSSRLDEFAIGSFHYWNNCVPVPLT